MNAPDLALVGGAVARDGDRLRVMVVHNRYQQAGGEDAVVRDEIALLEAHGVTVELYERSNDEIPDVPVWQLAAGTVWSQRTTAEVADRIASFRPHVMHAHNTFPLISPSLYFAAARAHVPIVQTLHNFRLFCAQAMFMRKGQVCEDCLGKLPWRGVLRRCYRSSASQSGVMVGMLAAHRALGTYRKHVTRYIALNDFCREKFIEAGLPAERVVVKPNFVEMPAAPAAGGRAGALFVGRLSVEKGVEVLVRAARLGTHTIDVVGTGPEQSVFEHVAGVRMVGWLDPQAIYARMRSAAYLVMPSIWYENFPRTLVEAYACGLPVIASRLGAMADLVEDGVTGLLFNAGDAADLARVMAWANAHPAEMRRMGEAARDKYAASYTPEANYSQLAAIYDECVRDSQCARAGV